MMSLMSRRGFMIGSAATVALSGTSGCTRVLSEVSGIGSGVNVKRDLPYGRHARQRLDLYMPEAPDSNMPLVLFLYGGSWKWGSRARYGFVGYALASRGMAVAVADYRLHPDVGFPTFNYDAARAVMWLNAQRKRFGLKPGPVHLAGHSAGAHIAALISLDPRYLAKWDGTPDVLGRFVGLAGPYGMFPSRVSFISEIFEDAESDAVTRPVEFANVQGPPMLLLHGSDDSLVAPGNSRQLATAQTLVGRPARAEIYEGVGHREIIMALAPFFSGIAPVLDDMTMFLKSA